MSPLRYAISLNLIACALAACSGGCVSWGRQATTDSGSASTASDSQVRTASYEAEKDDGLSWSDFNVDNLGKTTKKLTGQGPDRELAKTLYLEADDLFRQATRAEASQKARLFELAAPKYAAAADRWPSSQLAVDGRLMAAESYFFADNYAKASEAYEQLVKDFPNNRYLDQVDQRRFLIARYWLDLNRTNPEPFYYFNWFDNVRPWRDARGHGLRIYDKICVDDPTGRLSDDATLAAANEHFAAGDFEKADDKYTDLRAAYPSSEHQFLAHFLGLKAKLNCYQGPAYGGTLLEEAEKLIKQIRRQFPQEAEKERTYLDRVAAEIRFHKAEQLNFLAKYYDNRAEYRAAQRYYAEVVRDFSDTPHAQRADERLAQIAPLPPVPPQQLPWLVNLLPESDKVKPIIAASEKIKQQEMQEAAQLAAQPAAVNPVDGSPHVARTVNDPDGSRVAQAQAARELATEQNQGLEADAAQNPSGFPNIFRAFPFFR